jgi:F-type H+-transporting ATPase subunit b
MLELFKLAETESGGGIGSLFSALGINLQSLLVNLIAFLLIVWLLGKYVYPHLIKALDAKTAEFETATRLEKQAKAELEKAASEAGDLVKQARTEADKILATAKADSAAQQEAAAAKAQQQADRIVAEAREQLARDVNNARRELKTETAKLVAEATSAVLSEKLDGDADRKLITRSLEKV